jgi:8-oxo-dGTP pyrophosphatase MutT (NUDIX family)
MKGDEVPDICVEIEGYTLNVRVAAIMRKDGSILVHQLPDGDFWFLPGGRVAVGETFRDALARELREELGSEFQIGAFAFLCENFFVYNDRHFHEICTFFEVACDRGSVEALDQCEADGTRFRWMGPAELKLANIQPLVLKDILLNQAFDQKHVVVHSV